MNRAKPQSYRAWQPIFRFSIKEKKDGKFYIPPGVRNSVIMDGVINLGVSSNLEELQQVEYEQPPALSVKLAVARSLIGQGKVEDAQEIRFVGGRFIDCENSGRVL